MIGLSEASFEPAAPKEAFSTEEWDALVRHGARLDRLARGIAPPATPEQRRFVDVVRAGSTLAPETVYERAWIRYRQVRRPPLTVELVPRTSWFTNVRSAVPRPVWDRLRKACYRAAGLRCEVCAASGRQEAHEVWAYDDRLHVQTLLRLVSLCSRCHECKHAGRAASSGRLPQVLKHLARVNDWSEDDADLYLEGCFEQWMRRSGHDWTVDVSWLVTEAGVRPEEISGAV